MQILDIITKEKTWSAADTRGNYLFRARGGGQDHSGLSAGGAADGDSLERHDRAGNH